MTGEELRQKREEIGATQGEIGSIAGVAQANIAAMEKGTRPIGKKMEKRLEDALQTRKNEIEHFRAWLKDRTDEWMNNPELVELRRRHGMK